MNNLTARNLGLAIAMVTAIAGLVAAIAGLGAWLLPGGLVALLPSRGDSVVQEKTDRQAKARYNHKQAQSPLPGSLDTAPQEQPRNDSARDGYSQKVARTWEEQSFVIAHEEQKTLIPGCAALAVEFQEVDTVKFVTVRIAVGEESMPHAVASAGERFKFSCDNENYIASITSIDHTAEVVRVALEKASP